MEKLEPKEYKSELTILNEQKAEEEREKIKELNEKFRKMVKESEKAKRNSDESLS